MGFHIHTLTHAHTFPLTHVWSRFWPLCTCGKCICEIWHCRPLCPSAVWENVRIQTLNEHILQWVSSNYAFLEMIFMFFCLCETGVHHLMCITFPIVWTSRPLCALTAEEWVLEKDQKRKRKVIECVNVIYERAQCGLVVWRSVSFPMHRTHKNTSICIVLCGLACITFFAFVLLPECFSHWLIFLSFAHFSAHPFYTIK